MRCFTALLLLLRTNLASSRSEPIPLYLEKRLNAGRTVYDNQSPPVQAQESEVTTVRLAMYIEGMSSFRTQTMDFQLDVYFQQFWKDPRLAHNESRRVLVKDRAMLKKMWHPDTYFANARTTEFHQVTQDNFLVWIENDGSILYDTRISMIVVCTLNLEKWPLDSQRCNLRILSYAYTTDQLQIQWVDGDPITRNMAISMSDMHIVDLYPGLCDGNYSTGTWSCVTAEFFVKRQITHHVMQSYLPTMLIVVISWFSFWLDVDAVPARVSLAITTLLTLSTQASAARMALPEVSYMKAIDVWMGSCMIFVFGVMIEFVIVNYAQRKGRKWHRSDAELVMSSSLEAIEKSVRKKRKGSSVKERAREFLVRLRGSKEQRHLLDDVHANGNVSLHVNGNVASTASDDDELVANGVRRTPSSESCRNEVWKERDAEKAERLANWAVFDDDKKNSTTVWSRLSPNSHKASTLSYGATPNGNERNNETKKKLKPAEKWTNVVKTIQKHNPPETKEEFEKILEDRHQAGRNHAKLIDQRSRWLFPVLFGMFNLSYWVFYLYWKE